MTPVVAALGFATMPNRYPETTAVVIAALPLLTNPAEREMPYEVEEAIVPRLATSPPPVRATAAPEVLSTVPELLTLPVPPLTRMPCRVPWINPWFETVTPDCSTTPIPLVPVPTMVPVLPTVLATPPAA